MILLQTCTIGANELTMQPLLRGSMPITCNPHVYVHSLAGNLAPDWFQDFLSGGSYGCEVAFLPRRLPHGCCWLGRQPCTVFSRTESPGLWEQTLGQLVGIPHVNFLWTCWQEWRYFLCEAW